MSKPEELSISELRRRRQAGGAATGAGVGRPQTATPQVVDVSENHSATPIEPDQIHAEGHLSRLMRAVRRNWRWVVFAGFICGVAGLFIGYRQSHYSASLTLVQRDTAAVADRNAETDSFKPHEFSASTMVRLMVSPELARRVAALAIPAVSEADLRDSVRVEAVSEQELVILSLWGSRPQELVNLLNFYAKQAVELTREIQIEDATRLNSFLKRKLGETEAELAKASSEMESFQVSERTTDPEAQAKALIAQLGEVMTRLESTRMEAELLELKSEDPLRGDQAKENAVLERLKLARERLSEKLTRFTEAHPEVIALNAEIAELERQLSGSSTNAPPSGIASLASLRVIELKARKAALASELKKQEDLRDSLQKRITGLSQQGLQYQLLKAKQESLFRSRQFLADHLRAAQLYQENAAGYYRVLSEATLEDVRQRDRYFAGLIGLCAGLLLGLLGSVAIVCLVEVQDDRIKSDADVRRVTGLPVLATLGDLARLTDEEKDRWAFRTWTMINGKLNRTPDRGLVCGFVSARDGEGKSTWIDLLVAAARRRGLKVLKVTARTSAESTQAKSQGASPSPSPSSSEAPTAPVSGRAPAEAQASAPVEIANALSRPAEVALQLADSKAGAVDVCLPDWVWNLDHRRQWQRALDHWKSVENVVILVELPAAGLPESMLLAENVPQLIWLTQGGAARARETRVLLETLKHARCQFIGAVLNRAPGSLL